MFDRWTSSGGGGGGGGAAGGMSVAQFVRGCRGLRVQVPGPLLAELHRPQLTLSTDTLN
jgi:hypothetical protein